MNYIYYIAHRKILSWRKLIETASQLLKRKCSMNSDISSIYSSLQQDITTARTLPTSCSNWAAQRWTFQPWARQDTPFWLAISCSIAFFSSGTIKNKKHTSIFRKPISMKSTLCIYFVLYMSYLMFVLWVLYLKKNIVNPRSWRFKHIFYSNFVSFDLMSLVRGMVSKI